MIQPQHPPSAAQRLSALARAAEPPALASTDARRMVRRALLAGAARRRGQAARRAWLLAAAGFAAVAVVAALPWLRDEASSTARVATVREQAPAGSAAAPLELRLPDRDALVATAGAQFELLSADMRDRRVRVSAGAVAFDVEPLGSDERFAAVTPHATVTVRGTVFSVQVDARRTRVRVYEGSVAISSGGAEWILRAGDTYASDGVAVAAQEEVPLHAAARAMASRREQRSARSPDAAARPAPPPPPTAAQPAAVAGAQPAQVAPPAAVDLEQARAWLYDGQAERALRAARERTGARAEADVDSGRWLLLAGDALRSLGRYREAARAFADATPALGASERVQAGFKAADIELRVLGNPRAALAALDVAAVDGPGSPLRERGLLLRIEARHALGESIADLAQHYLAEYPGSAGASRIRELLAP